MQKIKIPGDVAAILQTFKQHGFEAYAVGGCVRDTLLGRKPEDWDITCSAKPMEIKHLFKKTVDTGIQHGTVTVILHGRGYEVTTYRIDGEYEDGRHPKQVEFTSNLVEDLKRRDFTINAMAYNSEEGIVDAFHGMQDLERKIIRCVGNPKERFEEDALRILRAVRFAAQLEFEIEEKTKQAMIQLASNLEKISKERIHTELHKLLMSDHPEYVRILYETGISSYIFPELDIMMKMPQNNPYHLYSVGEHTIHVLEHVAKDSNLRWAALFHDIGKIATRTTDEKGIDHFYGHGKIGMEIAETVMRTLRFDNKTRDIVKRLTYHHDDSCLSTKVSVRKSIYRIGKDIYPYYLALKEADILAKSPLSYEKNWNELQEVKRLYQEIITDEECLTLKELAINGKDLKEAGYSDGKVIGQTLQKLLEIVLENPEKNQKEILLSFLPQLSDRD